MFSPKIWSWKFCRGFLWRISCDSSAFQDGHLVTNPAFVKLHLQRSSKNTHTLLTFEVWDKRRDYAIVCPVQDLLDNPSSTLETLHYKHLPFNRSYAILGACNGLVCLQDSCIEDKFKEYWFRIGNPTTKVMTKDSPHIHLNLSDYKHPFRLMFGFGYNEWNDTYQVVLLDNNNKNQSQKLEVRVCCLGDTSWRNTLTCDAVATVGRRRWRETCDAFVSGTLNWLVFPKSRCSDDERGGTKMNELEIFCYDLKKKTCSCFSMPDGILEVPPFDTELKVLNGCLCLSHHHDDNFFVWLKRDFSDEKSWSKLLNYKNRPSTCYCCRHYMEIICMREKDDVVLLAETGLQAEFTLCNIRDNRIKVRQIYNENKQSLFLWLCSELGFSV